LGHTPVGLLGDTAVFSFYPAKPLGGLGDGGAVVSRDPARIEAVRMLRNHGQPPGRRFHHVRLGWNSRMDEINAAFLRRELATLPDRIAARRRIAERYDRSFAGTADGHAPQHRHPAATPYRYLLKAQDPDRLTAAGWDAGIELVRPWRPLPEHPAFQRDKQPRAAYPGAYEIADRGVLVPLHANLSDREVQFVIDRVTDEVAERV
jgi:dTDP-4-amino-4,6-dideoxygalactose transaminase